MRIARLARPPPFPPLVAVPDRTCAPAAHRERGVRRVAAGHQQIDRNVGA